jgi:hypothetical protein
MTDTTRAGQLLTLSQALTTDAGDTRQLLATRAALAAQVAGTTTPETPVEQAAADDAAATSEVTPVDLEGLATRVATLLGATSAGTGHPLSTYATLGEFARAVRNGDDDALRAFAIADQITSDNPGVIPPNWLSDVQGIVDRGARAITALGGPAPIGDAGMTVDWPYFDGDLAAIVGAQANQKDEVTSVKVSLKKGTTGLGTFAGGSDIAWQLIERSQPSYLDAYLRILTAAYAIVTDAAFCAALVAGGTGTMTTPGAPDTTTAEKFAAQVFEASVLVDDATGNPASAVLVARDVFLKLGALPGLWPTQYGTQNARGTADAATLRLEVSGLPVTYVPGLPASTAVISNELAARWHGTGPMFASAEDVLKLGRDQVVWGMGASALHLPKGVVVLKAAAR